MSDLLERLGSESLRIDPSSSKSARNSIFDFDEPLNELDLLSDLRKSFFGDPFELSSHSMDLFLFAFDELLAEFDLVRVFLFDSLLGDLSLLSLLSL